jgi:hypothetical protein
MHGAIPTRPRVVVESPTGESEPESLKNGTGVGLESESRVRVLQLC